MLWVLIDINDNKDCDGEEYVNEFEEDDYKTQMGDDQESDDEESDDEQDLEEDETEEARLQRHIRMGLIEIGGGVASCA
jgi:hypothetical protein